MRVCQKCGSECADDLLECPDCGIIFKKYEQLLKRQEAQRRALLIECRTCGQEISKHAAACPYCGDPQKETTATQPQAQTSLPPPKIGLKLTDTVPYRYVVLGLIMTGFMIWFMVKIDTPKPDKAHVQSQAQAHIDNQSCSQDIRCWGDKHNVAASIRCAAPVESVAKYSYRWTDGMLELKFDKFRWYDRERGIVTYTGDKIQFQNGFGAWQNCYYECDYNPLSDTVLDVRVSAK